MMAAFPQEVESSFKKLQESLPSFIRFTNDGDVAVKKMTLSAPDYNLKSMGVFSEPKSWNSFCLMFPGSGQTAVVETPFGPLEVFVSFIKDGSTYHAKMMLTDIRRAKWTGPPMMNMMNKDIECYQLAELVKCTIRILILGPAGESMDHLLTDITLEGMYKKMTESVDSFVADSNGEVAGEANPVPVKTKDLSHWTRSELEEKFLQKEKKLHLASSTISKLRKGKRNLKQKVNIKGCTKVTGIIN